MILKSVFKKKYISSILIIFWIELSSAHHLKQCKCNFDQIEILTNNNIYPNRNHSLEIHTQSDSIEIDYPNKIQLFGHVNIKQHNNIITSDKLMILNNNNYCIYADGNVRYDNNHILLTGSNAKIQLNNNDIDIYNGTFYLKKIYTYGIANIIMQRDNHHYTIIKNGDFTACISDDTYWSIMGSEITYNHHTHNIDIWNAYLKIKKIPIFYTPYLSFSLNQKNLLKSYIPNVGYNNKYGLICKIPFPLSLSQYHSGSIAPYYISNIGLGLKTKTYYSIKPGTGFISLNIIQNNKQNYDHYQNNFYKLYWKHNGLINKTWHIHIDYVLNNNSDYFNNINTKYTNNTHNKDINQKILLYYNNKYCKTSIAYLGNSNVYNNRAIQNKCMYTVAPQLELHLYYKIIHQKLLNFHIFNQFSKFIPVDLIYPESIRIHTEPVIRFSLNNHWGKFNAESKLKITHYRQKNFDNYNFKEHNEYQLQKTINRIIPQFKISGQMFFQKITNINTQNYCFLESKYQYLYIPDCFQENIGIYDSKMIHRDHNNLFYDSVYSGLDRIGPANQITSSINIHYFNQTNELFYGSIGQIFNLSKYKTINIKNIKQNLYNTDSTLKLLSGMGHWNINSYWNIHSELQYDTSIHAFPFGNTTLEYLGKYHQVFQTNYRYVNTKYLQKNSMKHYYKSHYTYHTISQLGIVMYFPLTNNWRMSYTYYHNIRTNKLVDQSIGVQHVTPCWIFNAIIERKITSENNKNRNSTYDNKIILDFNMYHSKSNLQSDLHKILNINMIPYQNMF